MPEPKFTLDLVADQLPPNVHAKLLQACDPQGVDVANVLLWIDRPFNTCPRCGQPIDQDLTGQPPATLDNTGLTMAFSQQHGCGEWLTVDWDDTDTDDATVEGVLAAAAKLVADRDAEIVKLRAAVTATLDLQLRDAAVRLAEPLEDGETFEERLEDVCTGNEVEPGVFMDGDVLAAWAYDPAGDPEPIRVHARAGVGKVEAMKVEAMMEQMRQGPFLEGPAVVDQPIRNGQNRLSYLSSLAGTVTAVSLELLDETDPGVLLCLDQRGAANDVYITLDCQNGQVNCFQRPGNIEWSKRVQSELVLVWQLPVLTAADANELMRTLVPHLQVILDGFTSIDVIDGASRDKLGMFTDAAEEAKGVVTSMCARENWGDGELVGWQRTIDLVRAEGAPAFADRVGLTAHTLDAELAQIVAREEDRAAATSHRPYFVLVGMLTTVTQLRDLLRGHVIDTLWETQQRIDRLKQERGGLFRQLAAFGLSSRTIEQAVRHRLSHPTIQKQMPDPKVLKQAIKLLQDGLGWHNDRTRLAYWGNIEALELVLVNDDPEVHYVLRDEAGEEVGVAALGIRVLDPRIVPADLAPEAGTFR